MKMAAELGVSPDEDYITKAEILKKSINDNFWMEDKGYYRYIVDSFGGCEHQEGLGQSFAILLGVADEEQTGKILKNQHITDEGISCVWPCFQRYLDCGGYGRHSGVIWPHVEAFWADAAAKGGRRDLMQKELYCMTRRALRDGQFAEIYHPESGKIYGGIQERNREGICEWKSELKQTWSASGYIRIIIFDVIGMNFKENGITFRPKLTDGMEYIELKNIPCRGAILNISVTGGGNKLFVDGEEKNSLEIEKGKEYNICISL